MAETFRLKQEEMSQEIAKLRRELEEKEAECQRRIAEKDKWL